jgi:thiol-disulfide isomerase/thioredoxin
VLISGQTTLVRSIDEAGFQGIPGDISSFSIVLFYAPWCSHSKQFLPVYDEVSLRIASSISPDINVYKVDCIVEKELYWQQKIDSFPTIKIYFGGREMIYEKERSATDFFDYINYLYKNSLLNMDKAGEGFILAKLTPTKPVVSVYIPANYDKEKSTDFLQRVDWACKKIESLTCGVTANPTSANLGEGLIKDPDRPALFVHRQFKGEAPMVALDIDEAAHVFTNDGEMFSFLLKHINPMLVDFTESNDDYLFSQKRPGFSVHVIYVASSEDPKTKEFFPIARSIGYDHFGKFIFIYADSSTDEPYTSKMLTSIKHAIPFNAPALLMVKSLKTKVEFFKQPANDDITEDSVRYWLSRALNGETFPDNIINME